MLKKFAEELKDARLKKDISLQQISHKTKIDIKFLEAIENGNYEVLPEVYLKAFIKSYAASVGLDETATLKKFDAAKAGKNIDERTIAEIPETPRKEEHIPGKKEYIAAETVNMGGDDDEDSSSRSSKNNLLILGLALGFIIIIIIAYMVFFNSSSTDIVTEKPYDEVITENKERFEEQEENTAADTTAMADTSAVITPGTSAAVQDDSLHLVIRAKDSTWIRVALDNSPRTQSFTIPPNSQRLIKAKTNYRLHIGNAGNIEMSLNNRALNFVGKKGEVKAVRIDTAGVHYISLTKTPAKNPNE